MWLLVRSLGHFHFIGCSMCRFVVACWNSILALGILAATPVLKEMNFSIDLLCMLYVGYILIFENRFVYQPEVWLLKEARRLTNLLRKR
jgi:hypothetical protein